MTYAQARAQEFEALRASGMFGGVNPGGDVLDRVTITAENTETAIVIHTAPVAENMMLQGPQMREMTATFDLARADFIRLAIMLDRYFECEGEEWQIRRINDDSAEATVQIYATKKK